MEVIAFMFVFCFVLHFCFPFYALCASVLFSP